MVGVDDGLSSIPPMATQTLWVPAYQGILSFPSGVVKWKSIRSKHTLEAKRIKCTYSKVLRIRVTHTMIPGLITDCYFRTRSMGWMMIDGRR